MFPPIVRSGVSYLCGITNNGYPVVCFPSNVISFGQVTIENIDEILSYFSQVALDIYGTEKLVVLVDFKGMVQQMRELITNGIKRFFCDNSEKLLHVYVIIPTKISRNGSVKALLFNFDTFEKQLDVWFNIHFKNVPTTLFHSYDQLCQFIDNDALTIDFQGRLPFNFNSWIHVQSMTECLESLSLAAIRNAKVFIKDIENKQMEMKDVSCKDFLDWCEKIEHWYSTQIAEMQVDRALVQCESYLNVLFDPYSDPLLVDMIAQPVFTFAKRKSLSILQQLNFVNVELSSTWKKLKKKMTEKCEIYKFELKVKELTSEAEQVEKSLKSVISGSNTKLIVVQPTDENPVENNLKKVASYRLYQRILKVTTKRKLVFGSVARLLKSRIGLTFQKSFEKDEKHLFFSDFENNFKILQSKFQIQASMLQDTNKKCVSSVFENVLLFYYHFLSNIFSSTDGEKMETLQSFDRFSCTLSDLMYLHEELKHLTDKKMRHIIRLLVFRCSLLLNAYSDSNENDTMLHMSWKEHMSAHG